MASDQDSTPAYSHFTNHFAITGRSDMKPSIPIFDRKDKVSDIALALRAEGAAIVRDVLAPGVMDVLAARVEADLARQEPGGQMNGGRTKGLAGLLARGPEFSEHLLNPLVLEVTDAILLPQCPMGPSAPGAMPQRRDFADSYAQVMQSRDPRIGPNCHHYRVNASAVGQIWAGGSDQTLHRETDIYHPFFEHDPDRPDLILACNWAGTDFRLDNGATRLVPGSHRWPKDRVAEEHEVAQAVMPKGSVVFWLGGTLHGSGASRSAEPRTGFLLTLVVDWLTTEENQCLTVPPEMARTLPERVQQLLGYRSSAMLNWVSGRSAENLLRGGEAAPFD